VLTEEKLDASGARREHFSQKFLRHPAHVPVVSESSMQTASRLLKETIKMTVVHELQSHDPANRVNLYNWILHSDNDGELTLT
jgi:hypothetical protein